MSNAERIYQRTQAGAAAAAFRHAYLPAEHRRILRFLEGETHSSLVRKLLRTYPEQLVSQWLADLEEMKLIESLPARSSWGADA
jgi:hypothetical protein